MSVLNFLTTYIIMNVRDRSFNQIVDLARFELANLNIANVLFCQLEL